MSVDILHLDEYNETMRLAKINDNNRKFTQNLKKAIEQKNNTNELQVSITDNEMQFINENTIIMRTNFVRIGNYGKINTDTVWIWNTDIRNIVKEYFSDTEKDNTAASYILSDDYVRTEDEFIISYIYGIVTQAMKLEHIYQRHITSDDDIDQDVWVAYGFTNIKFPVLVDAPELSVASHC